MKFNRKKSLNKDNTDRWLLTYADMITLLLAFFIVMYSMSRLDAKKFGQISEELNIVLKGGKQALVKYIEEQETNGRGIMKIGSLAMIQQQIEQRFKEVEKQSMIQTEVTERGLVVHIMESTLFKEGSATLLPGALDVLDMIYEKIKDAPNHVRIEGHTDDKPINNEQFKSNWELSTARATAVVNYFIANHNFPPDKISALGYGEYRPRRPNNSIENRSQNRRVDIVILTMELTMKEPSSQLYNIRN
jgi:chemotaxis protein MotB